MKCAKNKVNYLNKCSDCGTDAPEGLFKLINSKPKFLCSKCIRNAPQQSVDAPLNIQLVSLLKKNYSALKKLPAEFRNSKYLQLLESTIKKYEEILNADNRR